MLENNAINVTPFIEAMDSPIQEWKVLDLLLELVDNLDKMFVDRKVVFVYEHGVYAILFIDE